LTDHVGDVLNTAILHLAHIGSCAF